MGHIGIKEKDKLEHELTGYMIGVEYLYHLGNDLNGTTIFGSIQDLYNAWEYMNETQFPQDGMVKVKVGYIEHIKAEDCWKAKQKEEMREKLIEDQIKKNKCIRIGNSVIKADLVIDILKREGFL